MPTTFEQGRYWGKITRQHLGQTSTGNAQLVLSFQVVGKLDPHNPKGELLACPQYERRKFRVITDKTLEYVTQDLDALGWYGNKWSQFEETDKECVDVRGKELAFSCKHEPKQIKDEATGKYVATSEMREVWSIAQAGSGPPVKPLDAKTSSKLDAMFGKALKGRKPQEPKPQKPAQKPAQKPTEAKKPAGSLTPDEVNAELEQYGGESSIPF